MALNRGTTAANGQVSEQVVLIQPEIDVSGADEETPLLRSDSASLPSSAGADTLHAADDAIITKPRAAGIICSLGTLLFLQGGNISALTTTQSIIATDLDALTTASWLTSAYVIAMSSTTPLMGRLCKIFPPRACMFAASLAFALGNLISGLAPGFEGFLTGRAIAGVGGAGIVAIAVILLLEMASERRRGLALAGMNAGFTAGVSLGAVVAGGVAPAIGWRPLFWAQAPVAAIAGLCLFLSVPAALETTNMDSKAGKEPLSARLARLDWLGLTLMITTLVLFLVSLASAQVLVVPLIISLVLLAVFAVVESRWATDPVIPMSVLSSPRAFCACLATAGLMMTRWLVLFYTPVYAIAVRGWQPSLAGSILIPANAGFATGGLLAGTLHIKRAGSFWFACIFSIFSFAITLAVLGSISTSTSPTWAYLLVPFVNGFFTGAALNYTLVHALHITAPSVHFIISSLLLTFRGFGASFGSAIGGGIFARVLSATFRMLRERHGLPEDEGLLRTLLGSPAVVAQLGGVEKLIAIASYEQAFRVLFYMGAGMALVAAVVQAGTGWWTPEAKAEAAPGDRVHVE